MACPNCDHTMHHVGTNARNQTYWCPRCGTLKEKWGPEPNQFAMSKPKLVERVVEFCGTLCEEDQKVIDNIRKFGIEEAIKHPDVY